MGCNCNKKSASTIRQNSGAKSRGSYLMNSARKTVTTRRPVNATGIGSRKLNQVVKPKV